MKLIDEKEVEDKINLDCEYFTYYEESAYELAFNKGVEFAEYKLSPLMIEFAEWVEINYFSAKSEGKNWFPLSIDTNKPYTTEQLLEQFLNSKQ